MFDSFANHTLYQGERIRLLQRSGFVFVIVYQWDEMYMEHKGSLPRFSEQSCVSKISSFFCI